MQKYGELKSAQLRTVQQEKRRRRKLLVGTASLLLILAAAWFFARALALTENGLAGLLSEAHTGGQVTDDANWTRLEEALANNAELADFAAAYAEKKGTWEESPQLDTTQDRSIPLFLQWDAQWGYAPYGDGLIGLDGCGPTCLSMVYVGLTGDTSMHPRAVADFAVQNGYLTDTGTTQWALMTDGAATLGLQSWEVPLDEGKMAQTLADGCPIICSVRAGDFTTAGHFIVLYAYEDGSFRVNDPNSRTRSDTAYSYDRLSPQIKAMWAFSAAE